MKGAQSSGSNKQCVDSNDVSPKFPPTNSRSDDPRSAERMLQRMATALQGTSVRAAVKRTFPSRRREWSKTGRVMLCLLSFQTRLLNQPAHHLPQETLSDISGESSEATRFIMHVEARTIRSGRSSYIVGQLRNRCSSAVAAAQVASSSC